MGMHASNSDKPRAHAVALFSGGLDSTLAILLMLRQNIRVTALTFMTHFGCDLSDRSSCGSNPYPLAEQFGFDVKLMHLGQKFVDIVKEPQYGRGSEMNVCVDCRILMLREAKAFMDMIKADFLVTGEVLGQRPFSQVKGKMRLVENKTGFRGLIVRPLSGQLLPPTIPEERGLVDRSMMESISGRGRSRQMELAREFGVEDFRTGGSGCLLTDAGYSRRLRDLLAHKGEPVFDDINLLRVGRHFRIDKHSKLVVGRNAEENARIKEMKRHGDVLLEVLGGGSPQALLAGDVSKQNIETSARITARYTHMRDDDEVLVQVLSDNAFYDIPVTPADDGEIERYIVKTRLVQKKIVPAGTVGTTSPHVDRNYYQTA